MNKESEPTSWGSATQAIRSGFAPGSETEHSPPIYMNSSFVYTSAAQAAARFDQSEPGNIYSRFTNPTVQAFERRLATLEGGQRCIATASGMSAILTCVMALLKTGDHVLVGRNSFGSTINMFRNFLLPFGIQVDFLDPVDVASWGAACRTNTRMLLVETPSNPLMELADIAALAEVAHAHNALLVVDNCFATPVLQQPLKLGADVVVHSATKYIDGQGRALGGAFIANAELADKAHGFVRNAGPCMSPFNAWVFLKSLETLPLRMQAHCANALQLAEFLQAHAAVERVYYPGLASHPQHALAKAQMQGFGGMVSFEVRGGQAAAWQVVDATRMLSITGNLGDTRSTITHPATTTHARIGPEARAVAGVGDSLLRVSVGLEDIEDIRSDLARGLDALLA